jgi:hypothetical protein
MRSEVRVEGLETLDYVDNLMNRSRFTEQADAITFDGEVGIIMILYHKTSNQILHSRHLPQSDSSEMNTIRIKLLSPLTRAHS